ncbi:MAG: molybdenum cofactor guanylyltransferase [Planctomycetaceae bacterium]
MSRCPADPSLAAIIVCGGRSVRMGTDKASLMFGDETLLQRVCRLTRPAVQSVVVVAAQDQSLPPLSPEIRIIRDQVAGAGPLGGLLTALEELQQRHRDPDLKRMAVWLGCCDSPFVNAAVIRELHQRLRRLPSMEAVVVQHQGRLHPLNAVYDIRMLPTLRTLFSDGERRMMSLLDQLPVSIVPGSELTAFDPQLRFLENVNSPADLDDAWRKWTAEERSSGQRRVH